METNRRSVQLTQAADGAEYETFSDVSLCGAGLGVFVLAFGQDVSPTAEPQERSTVEPTVALGGESYPYEIVSSWGESPDSGARFASPNGIAIDREGNVYVSESGGQTGLNRCKKPGMM